MSLKDQVGEIIHDVTGHLEHLPERAERTRKAANDATRDLSSRATEMIRRHPGRTLLGAFLVGFVIAKVAKHA